MIPSVLPPLPVTYKVYQRGLVIDSQLAVAVGVVAGSVSKGIGD